MHCHKIFSFACTFSVVLVEVVIEWYLVLPVLSVSRGSHRMVLSFTCTFSEVEFERRPGCIAIE